MKKILKRLLLIATFIPAFIGYVIAWIFTGNDPVEKTMVYVEWCIEKKLL